MLRFIYGIFILILISCMPCIAGIFHEFSFTEQDTSGIKNSFFDSDEFLDVRIITNMDSLLNDVGDNPSYHNARISYLEKEGNWVELNCEIRVRGNFRKKTVNCNFPPFKLRFEKKDRENTIFEKIKYLKMVTHCQSNDPEFEKFVLQEYLIYRMYNILSDFSLKTRLAKVTYMDVNNPDYRLEKYAFFIEDLEDMAQRVNGHILNIQSVNPFNVDKDYYLLVSFYEYLIINTDWSLSILHNIELISPDYFKPPIPVPFDFDWSGLINIPYEIPAIGGFKTNQPERIYQGPCASNKDLRRITKLFLSKKMEILNLYNTFPYLSDEYKAETIENLQFFFLILEDKSIFRSVFVEHCHD